MLADRKYSFKVGPNIPLRCGLYCIRSRKAACVIDFALPSVRDSGETAALGNWSRINLRQPPPRKITSADQRHKLRIQHAQTSVGGIPKPSQARPFWLPRVPEFLTRGGPASFARLGRGKRQIQHDFLDVHPNSSPLTGWEQMGWGRPATCTNLATISASRKILIYLPMQIPMRH